MGSDSGPTVVDVIRGERMIQPKVALRMDSPDRGIFGLVVPGGS